MGNLINKEEFDRLMKSSGMMQWAAKELDLAGYKAGSDDNPNTWMREQVLESLAVFVSHGNSGGSAPFEINLVKQLSSWKPISKLHFTDDEWEKISEDGTMQNKRCSAFFKNADGSISWTDAVAKKVVAEIRYKDKKETKLDAPTYWSFGWVAEGVRTESGIMLSGIVYHNLHLKEEDVKNGFYITDTIYLNVIDVEIAPDSWLVIVLSDEKSLGEVKDKYVLEKIHIPEIEGFWATNLQRFHENLIIQYLKGGKK